jgi:capsular polysaccharide biosynthesis protein
MSKPASEPRRSPRVMWRSGILVAIMAAVGLLAGVATAAMVPVMVTTSALVILPQAAQNAAAVATAAVAGQPDGFTATQEIIAGSNAVLVAELPEVHPATSLTELRHDIQIGSPASDIISISATGETAGDAEATANAVARSYVRYVGSAGSPALRLPATLLQLASSATGPAWFTRMLAGAMLGAVSGLLAGVVAAVVSRRLIPWPAD